MTRQEQIQDLQLRICKAQTWMAGSSSHYRLSKNNGERNSLEEHINTMKLELQSLLDEQAKQDEADLFGENETPVVEINIDGNIIQKIDIEPKEENVSELVEVIGMENVEVKASRPNALHILFESSIGNALWHITEEAWCVVRFEVPLYWKEKFLEVFGEELSRLEVKAGIPTFQPVVVDNEEYEWYCSHIESLLILFKNNGKLRTGWKAGQTCYKYFNTQYKKILKESDYCHKLNLLQDLVAKMWLNRRPILNMQVLQNGISEAAIEAAKREIQRFER